MSGCLPFMKWLGWACASLWLQTERCCSLADPVESRYECRHPAGSLSCEARLVYVMLQFQLISHLLILTSDACLLALIVQVLSGILDFIEDPILDFIR
mmetsp:Transcript_6330/g.15270  ORF Transcript_6330/g.15270 Transcript_6330/m.15270 type:complete len:98 (-) Transcript_6330:376-669(-)